MARNSRNAPRGLVFYFGLAFVIGCSSCSSDVAIRSLPGTEQVAVHQFCVSVSPDERWLAFTEWVLPKSQVFEDLPVTKYHTRIAKLNLQSGEITRYTVDSSLAHDLGIVSAGNHGWIRQAGYEIIEQRFRPPGWRGERFYCQPHYDGAYVALDSNAARLRVVSVPELPGTCSDCPPMTSVEFRDRSWDLLSNDVSAVVRDGEVRSVYYVSSPYQRNQAHHRAIYRITEASTEQAVVEAPGKKAKHVIIGAVRASQNERYLAYVVDSKEQTFLAGARNELFIRELATSREKRIAKYGYMGNLIWSPDSNRLYFAGGEYASDSAIRVVDVPASFSK